MVTKMQVNEAWVKKEVRKILRLYTGLYYYMPQAGMYGTVGLPDFILCYKGQFIGIETKANGNTPTEIQQACHAQIRKAGGRVMVIDEHNLDSLQITLSSI